MYTLQQAIDLARTGVKMTHELFLQDEYMTIQGNRIIFEDGCKMFIEEFTDNKAYLLSGWSKFNG